MTRKEIVDMHKFIIKKPDAPFEVIETDNTYSGECGKLIDGTENITVQRVYMNDNMTFTMLVDEDGLPKELPLNFFLTVNNPYFPVQAIVGTVVFVRTKYVNPYEEEIWDFEVESITDEDIEQVEKLLDPAYQRGLAIQYSKGRGL
jgi:hypothetical protein